VEEEIITLVETQEVQEVEVVLGDQLDQVILRVPHLVKVITAALGLLHQIMVVVEEEELAVLEEMAVLKV